MSKNTPKNSEVAPRHRKPLLIAVFLTIAWLGLSSVTGPLFGNLSTVQKNDNSKFLPNAAESTRATTAITKFADNTANNQTPPDTLLDVGIFHGGVNDAEQLMDGSLCSLSYFIKRH